jgi:hypothetical protein
MGITTFVAATMTCLKLRCRKKFKGKYNLPIFFINHHVNDLLLCFMFTVSTCAKMLTVADISDSSLHCTGQL